MTEEDLRFILTAYDRNKRVVGDKYSFIASDRIDAERYEEDLLDHVYTTLDTFEEVGR